MKNIIINKIFLLLFLFFISLSNIYGLWDRSNYNITFSSIDNINVTNIYTQNLYSNYINSNIIESILLKSYYLDFHVLRIFNDTNNYISIIQKYNNILYFGNPYFELSFINGINASNIKNAYWLNYSNGLKNISLIKQGYINYINYCFNNNYCYNSSYITQEYFYTLLYFGDDVNIDDKVNNILIGSNVNCARSGTIFLNNMLNDMPLNIYVKNICEDNEVILLNDYNYYEKYLNAHDNGKIITLFYSDNTINDFEK